MNLLSPARRIRRVVSYALVSVICPGAGASAYTAERPAAMHGGEPIPRDRVGSTVEGVLAPSDDVLGA